MRAAGRSDIPPAGNFMKPDYRAETRRTLITGPSGSGKTSAALCLITSWKKKNPAGQLFVFDHKGEFSLRLPARQLSRPGQMQAAFERGATVVFNPHVCFTGSLDVAFQFFTDWTFLACSQGPAREKLVVIDELQNFVGAARSDIPRGLSCLAETGRCYRTSLLCIAQASNFVNNRLRSQFNQVLAFRQNETRALDFLETCGLEKGEVASLPEKTCLLRQTERLQTERYRLRFVRNRPRLERI